MPKLVNGRVWKTRKRRFDPDPGLHTDDTAVYQIGAGRPDITSRNDYYASYKHILSSNTAKVSSFFQSGFAIRSSGIAHGSILCATTRAMKSFTSSHTSQINQRRSR